MRAGIGNAVCCLVVLRQVGVFCPVAECELGHFHARIAAGIQHFLHFRRDKAEVFCNDREVAQCSLCSFKQGSIWTFSPFADFGSWVAVRNAVIAFKSTEVVDPNGVINRGCKRQPLNPPCISGFLVVIPIIERIAPELPRWRKDIRRTTCNGNRAVLSVEFKQFRLCPDFYAVIGNIDWHITDEGNAIFVAVRFQLIPL